MAEKTITISINDIDEKCLLHYIMDIDANAQWTLQNKINNCWTKFRTEWVNKLTNDSDFTDDIPMTKPELIKLVLARSDYKDMEAKNKLEF
mgnify:FL=1|tara:strand:- start:1086 stop:1358 length:273 start_codon:yes stop_codon:yes gene_type:complete